MRSQGRPTDLTEAAFKVVIEALKNGTPKYAAAALVKVNPKTLCNWAAIGEDALKRKEEEGTPVPPHHEINVRFFLSMKAAKGDAINGALKNITRLGKKNWQANAWLLGRLDPKNFADNRGDIREMHDTIDRLLVELATLKAEAAVRVPAAVPASGPQPVPAVPMSEPVQAGANPAPVVAPSGTV